MKRLVVLGLLLLPLTLLGQSRADVMIGSYGFKQALQPKSNKTNKVENNVQRKVVQAEHKAKVEKAKKLTKEKCSNNKCTFKQVLKAIFLGCKFPWETDKEFHNRKMIEYTPAGQPFK